MKTYLIFAGMDYYPHGGWGDYQTSAWTKEDIDEVLTNLADMDYDWYQVVDSSNSIIIDKGNLGDFKNKEEEDGRL